VLGLILLVIQIVVAYTLSILTNGMETDMYGAFHRFGQAKFTFGGSVLGSSQFSVLPQLPRNTMLGLKEVKIDSKISNSLC